MKKYLQILLAVLTASLLLTGCTASTGEAVTAVIEEIGTVTLESLTAIETAEARYEELAQEEKELVTNHDVLVAARKTYDELVLLDNAESAISATGQVVYIVDSYSFEMTKEDFLDPTEEGIANEIAWMEEEGNTVVVSEDGSIYTITVPESTVIYKEDYHVFQDLMSALQPLKEAGLYNRLSEESLRDLDLMVSGAVRMHEEIYLYDYSCNPPKEFVDQAAVLIDAFPAHEEMDELRSYCYSYYSILATEARESGDYERAIELYTASMPYDVYDISADSIIRCYKYMLSEQIDQIKSAKDTAATNSELAALYRTALADLEALSPEIRELYEYQQYYQQLSEEMDKFMAELLPENGKQLENTMVPDPLFPRFYAKYELATGDKDVLFKIYRKDNPEEYILTYVHKNSTSHTALPAGTFRVRCAIGDTWYGLEELFGESTEYYNFSDYETTFGVPVGGKDDILLSYTTMGKLRASILINNERNPALVAITADTFNQ